MRRILTWVLLFSSIAFATISGWNLWVLIDSRGGQWLIGRAASQVAVAVDGLTLRDATGPAIKARLATELAREPRDWIIIDSLLLIAEDHGHGLAPDLQTQLSKARGQDHSTWKSVSDCGRCVLDAGVCPMDAAMMCGLAVNLTPVGDIAGVARAGIAYAQGEEIDQIDAVLSVIGLGATSLALVSGGSSLTVKAGVGTLKFAHLAGKLPAPVSRRLHRAATEGIDWAGLHTVRRSDDLAGLIRMDALRPAVQATEAMGQVVNGAGLRQGLYLLEGADSIGDLRRTGIAAEALSDRTVGYFSLIGKSKLLRMTMRLADEVWAIIAGMMGLLISLAGLILARAGSTASKSLRRSLRP